MKFAITLILGLVFQLAQVMPGMAALQASCQEVSACCCCDSPSSCPCADEGGQDQNSTPTPLQSAAGMKVPAMRAADARVSVQSSVKRQVRVPAAISVSAEPFAGYQGIRLSVAFCRFVI